MTSKGVLRAYGPLDLRNTWVIFKEDPGPGINPGLSGDTIRYDASLWTRTLHR